ncbi:MAG: hypothetical protein ACP5HD_05230 [Thermoproteus sp.]
MPSDVVLSVVGLAATLIGMLGGALYWLGREFREIDDGFEEMDRRFDEVVKRFDEVDRRLASFADSMRSAVVAMDSAVVEFLGVKGLISQREASFLVNELMRLSQSIKANPISREEAEYIRQVLARGDVDKIGVEELERVAEIAKRWWYEDGGEIAYKIFLYAWMLRAYKLYGGRDGR